MLFVTFALAQADQAAPEPCAPWLSATWPVQGASDVPVDIAPTALFETCGSHTDVLATVVDGTETVVWSGILAPTFAGDTAILELPQFALADGTSYRVDLEADGYPVSFGFTAGPTAAVALTDGPTLELGTLVFYEGDGILSLVADVIGPDSHIVRVQDPTGEWGASVAGQAVYLGWAGDPTAACVHAEVRDDQGSWVAGPDLCYEAADIETVRPVDEGRTFGCSSTGGAGLTWAPLALLGLIVRRRSRMTPV